MHHGATKRSQWKITCQEGFCKCSAVFWRKCQLSIRGERCAKWNSCAVAWMQNWNWKHLFRTQGEGLQREKGPRRVWHQGGTGRFALFCVHQEDGELKQRALSSVTRLWTSLEGVTSFFHKTAAFCVVSMSVIWKSVSLLALFVEELMYLLF